MKYSRILIIQINCDFYTFMGNLIHYTQHVKIYKIFKVQCLM